LKIALVTHTFFPSSVGGREKYVFYLAKNLAKKGHDVRVFTCSDRLKKLKEKKNGFETIYSKTIKIPSPGAKYRICFGMLRDLKKFDPDIIHAHDSRHYTTFLSYIYSKRSRKPMILTEHGFHSMRNVTNLLYFFYNKLVSRKIFRQAEKVIAVSDSLKKELVRLGVPEKKIAVVHNAIDLQDYSPKAKQVLKSEFGKRMVFSAGRLIEEKGFQHLIRAVPCILKEFPETMFLIAGPDHYYRSHLEKLSKGMGVSEKVLLLGSICEDELRSFMKSADAIVIPSTYEPFGIIALEAMAFEKPIVASDVGGLSEIFSGGGNALLVKPGNHEQICEGIKRIFRDKRLAKKLSLGAGKKVRDYDWGKSVDKVISLYKEAIHR
jgi:1,4-alpha-glucan branching enzyme